MVVFVKIGRRKQRWFIQVYLRHLVCHKRSLWLRDTWKTHLILMGSRRESAKYLRHLTEEIFIKLTNSWVAGVILSKTRFITTNLLTFMSLTLNNFTILIPKNRTLKRHCKSQLKYRNLFKGEIKPKFWLLKRFQVKKLLKISHHLMRAQAKAFLFTAITFQLAITMFWFTTHRTKNFTCMISLSTWIREKFTLIIQVLLIRRDLKVTTTFKREKNSLSIFQESFKTSGDYGQMNIFSRKIHS